MKSQFTKEEILKKKNNIKSKELELLFERTQEIIFHETQVLWQSSEIFLLANTILYAFIAQHIFGLDNQILLKPNLGLFTIAVLGIIICITWLGSYRRISNYYRFRIAQTRQREPEGWHLYNGDGKSFSEGNKVEIFGKTYSLGFGRAFKNHNIVVAIIVLFILIYLTVFVITSPWIFVKR